MICILKPVLVLPSMVHLIKPVKSMKKSLIPKVVSSIFFFFTTGFFHFVSAQSAESMNKPLLGQPGIIITITLIMIPVLLGALFAVVKANNAVRLYTNKKRRKEGEKLEGGGG